MDYKLYPIDQPLHYFNAVEYWPVEDLNGDIVQIEESQIDENPVATYFWSVYLHYDHEFTGRYEGIICVADLPTKEAAEAYANGLEAALGAIINDRLIK